MRSIKVLAMAFLLTGPQAMAENFVWYSGLPVPDSFLEYAKKAGYTHVIALADPAYFPNDWELDIYNQPNGFYNWAGPKGLHAALVQAFQRTEAYGLRLVPNVNIGGRHASGWFVTNANIDWNTVTDGGSTASMPEIASTVSGADQSFASVLSVIYDAHSTSGVGYPIEFIHIGLDESFTYGGEVLAATTSTVDQDFITNNGDDAAAYYMLYASHVNRRVNQIIGEFGYTVRTLMWGDGLDVNHMGGLSGPLNQMGWSTGGRATVPVQTANYLFEQDLLDVQANLIIMPWQYEPETWGVYDAEETLDIFANYGYSFIPTVAYPNASNPDGPYDSDYLEATATGIQMMHNWVSTASLSKYDEYRVGYCAATFGDEPYFNPVHYWLDGWEVDSIRNNWFNMVPALAKAAKFYPERAGLLSVYEYYGAFQGVLYAPIDMSTGYTQPVGPTSSLAFFTGNLNPSHAHPDTLWDHRGDLVTVWNNSGVLAFTAYRSNEYGDLNLISENTDIYRDYRAIKFLKGDMNGDGRMDVFQLWDNDEPTSNRLGLRAYTFDGRNYSVAYEDTDVGGSGHLDFLTGDINGDGMTDLYHFWNNSGWLGVEVYASKGESFVHRWSASSILPAHLGGSSNIRFFVEDYDRDGDTDIYHVWDNSGRTAIEVYKSDGAAYSHFAANSDVSGAGYPQDYLTGDMDGDGKVDVLQVWNNGGDLAIAIFHATGAWSTGFSTNYTNSNLGTYVSGSTYQAADANGDGLCDLLVSHDTGSNEVRVTTFLSNGTTLSYYDDEGIYVDASPVNFLTMDGNGP